MKTASWIVVRKTTHFCFLFTLLQLSYLLGSSQTDQTKEVVDRIQNLASRYRDSSYISFDVKYLYATENKPSKFIDSVEGSFKLNHGQYWYRLDNTESISNDSEQVTVFNEDKLIYIGRPVTVQSANPMAILDSILSNNQYSTCSITKSKSLDKIVINFNPGFPYRKIEYQIDNKSGFIMSMTALIKSDQLNDPASKTMFDKQNEYGVIQVYFTNYKTGGLSGKDFSSGKYVTRQGKTFQPVSTYSAYQIMDSRLKD
jgi:hypothetical protein